MDKVAIFQAATQAAEALLEATTGCASWELEDDNLMFRTLSGDLFTPLAHQELLTRELPAQLQTPPFAPRSLPAAALGLPGPAQLLALPFVPTDKPTALPVAGLLITLPEAFILTERHRVGLENIAHLTYTALNGLDTLKQSYRRLERLEAVATVGRDATVFLNPEELLNRVTQLISEQLGFYHVGIFIVDPDQHYATLKATNSEGGRALIARGHRLKVGEQGLVGYVTGTGEPRMVMDVADDATHFANPLLPLTRAEITLPMRHRGQIIGALDVQSVHPDAFTQDDFTALQIMADQLANALVNARLYKALQHRLQDTHLLREVMLRASALSRQGVLEQALKLLKKELPYPYQAFFYKNGPSLYPITGSTWPQNALPLEGTPWSEVWAAERYWRTDEAPLNWAGAEIRTLAAAPIREGEKTLLLFAVATHETAPGRQHEVNFMEALAAELSILLQNARLYESSVLQAEMLKRLIQAGEQIAASLAVDAILEILAKAILAEIEGSLEIGLLLDSTHLEWVKRAATPGIIPTYPFSSLDSDFSLDDINQHLGQRILIMPEEYATLKAQIPEMCEIFDRLPPKPLFLQTLQTTERAVGLLLLFTEKLSEPDHFQEQIAAVQILSNQAALALNNAQLVARLSVQAEELTLAYEEANRLNEIRTQMIQNVSHELRTPLGIILGYAEMLMEGNLGSLTGQQRNVLYTIYSRARSLNRMIQNLTTLQGTLELAAPAPVAFQNLIPQVLEEFQEMAARQQVRFYIEVPSNLPPVPGDEERLRLVLGHLIENAIKFSPEGGHVMIRALTENDWMYISVIDQGIGIPPEHRKHIFERFYQVDGSTKRRYGGMGIGLALVMEIVEAHGGKVEVDSAANEGSTFTIRLPLSGSLHKQQSATPQTPPDT